MSDETHFEKTFVITATVTVTAKEPLTYVNQQVVETLIRTTLAKLEGMALHGVGAPTALIKASGSKVEEKAVQIPEPIILGRKVGDVLVTTDDAKLLLETWHKESHAIPHEELKQIVIGIARELYPQKPDDEPPKWRTSVGRRLKNLIDAGVPVCELQATGAEVEEWLQFLFNRKVVATEYKPPCPWDSVILVMGDIVLRSYTGHYWLWKDFQKFLQKNGWDGDFR